MNAVTLEHFYEDVKNGKIDNRLYAIPLNINMAFTYLDPTSQTHWLWSTPDITGLAYEAESMTCNIFPLYYGIVLKDCLIYRETDLHKPRSIPETVRIFYKQALDIHDCIERHQESLPPYASFEDYVSRVKVLFNWFEYHYHPYIVGQLPVDGTFAR